MLKTHHSRKLTQLSLGMLLLTTVSGAAITVAETVSTPPLPNPNTPSEMRITQRPQPQPTQPDKPVGGLYITAQEDTHQAFPLKHTEVDAKISGNLSRVQVTQTFENPFEETLEAVYVFPLPDESAVDDMEIQIGDRIIRSQIKRREEAQEIYEQARQQGRTAGLLEQERDNIFTQSLANIKPGEQINVIIRYTESLKFEGGRYEFVFPMVVGPRYIPGTPLSPANAPMPRQPDTDQVPDASRITPPVLPPGTRSGHDIGVSVTIDAGVPVQQVMSTSHQIQTEREGNQVRVKLAEADTIPNKDLILRYQVAGENTEATVLTQADDRGGHFAVYFIPAIRYQANEIVPKDVVFLMDTSGSQMGDPLLKSQELMRRFINGLNPNDTFTIIDFANTTQALSTHPLPNTAANRQRALAYVDALNANGGTELLNGIRAVLNFPPAPSDRLRSIVLLTDGYIGNDREVIAEVQQHLKPGNRLYGFGVGSSVNRFLINRLAEVGRGTSQVVRQDEPTQAVAEKFFQQINNPVLTNIELQWQGGGASPEIYPGGVPDLFTNQPLVLLGRKSDRQSGKLQIRGITAGGQRYEKTLTVEFPNVGGMRVPESSGSSLTPEWGNVAIAQLWGRAKIKELMNQMFGGETTTGVQQVTDLSLAYRLLSQYTAFVAVSEEVRVDPDGTRRRVEVPVEIPQGVSYEGIFGSDDEGGMLRSNASIPYPAARTRTSGGVRGLSGDQFAMPSAAPAPMILESTRIEPMPQQESEALPRQLEIIRADGLDQTAINALTEHLNHSSLPTGINGDLVFKVLVRNGRVQRVMLDENASTIVNAEVIKMLRQQLQTWQAPGMNQEVLIQVRIQS